MTREGWKNVIADIIVFSKEDELDLLVNILCEYQEAKQILIDAGYGVTGMSLIQIIKESAILFE